MFDRSFLMAAQKSSVCCGHTNYSKIEQSFFDMKFCLFFDSCMVCLTTCRPYNLDIRRKATPLHQNTNLIRDLALPGRGAQVHAASDLALL